MEHGTPWLTSSLIYLGAAVLAVPLARLLGLGSIIGYLAAGIAIGPWGLKLVTDPQAMLHFAEFGVVLMLFLVGLELEPKRLWSLRRPIFGWGSVQLFGSAALIAGIALAAGVDWRLAVVAGLGLGMSSTAIGLGVLAERNLMPTSAGQSVLSVALLQDMAAIPILAILPLLAMAGAADAGGGWLGGAKALGVIVAIILGGRLLLRPALRWIARSDTPEIFTAASLLLVVATAALMQSVGLSMALGAFLAGVLLAESEYRRELETDLEPFKGLLLGLFFIAVGMSIDFAVVLASPLLVAAVVLGFLVVKALVLVAMARAMPVPLAEAPVFVILLAQGGEFREASRDRPGTARAHHHLRLRPLRADRGPADQRQRLERHGAGPQCRSRGQPAQLRLAGVLWRRDPAGPAACGRCRQGPRHRGGHRQRGAEPGRGGPGARALSAGHAGGPCA